MFEHIPSSEEIRAMSKNELNQLAQDLRTFIIDKTAQKGGHLASNLGTVELTIALFSSFDFPKDKVIFDVGHQCYSYKLLSGRMDGFDSLRDLNGMSGFPKRRESEYDAFDTGHSSTAISAGLGYVRARDIQGEDFHVVSMIGDGSFTGGEAYEALNNAAGLNSNFIIILNDNEMSISKNVGGFGRYLMGIRAGRVYNRVKVSVKNHLSLTKLGQGVSTAISHLKDWIKEIIIPSGMFFENLGVTYLGPVDGHNIQEMCRIFKKAKNINRSVLIHVKTEKGKGYAPAEQNPAKFHGIGPFEVETGEEKQAHTGICYSNLFGETLVKMAETDDRICAITAAMTENTGLSEFRKNFKKRFFDVGIAEQHAVTFAAGLALGGLHPYVAIYSSFLQRAYDQILEDVCLQDLGVTFCIDRAGIVGRDGETHQGIFDLSYLSSIPNMTILAPSSGSEFVKMMEFSKNYQHPLAIRYPRGNAKFTEEDAEPISYGKGRVLKQGGMISVLCFGNQLDIGKEVFEKLTEKGYHPTLVDMRFVKPIDTELILDLTKSTSIFVSLEENVISGGAGMAVLNELMKIHYAGQFISSGIPDEFVPQGNPDELLNKYHMDATSIVEEIEKKLL